MKYKVTGTLPYLDHQPGETFVATIDPLMEQRAVHRGAIQVVSRQPERIRKHRAHMPQPKEEH